MKKLSLLISSMLLVAGVFAQWPATIGPDNYGYTMENFDNTDARYVWLDVSPTSATPGVDVTGLGDDNFVGPFNLGFDFPFYWLQRDEVFIGSNGFISFNRGFNLASQGGGFGTFPNNDSKNEVIAPLLSDLSFATPNAALPNPGKCYFYTNNQDLAVISFVNVPFWNNGDPAEWAGANSFQIHLSASDSTIKFVYLSQDGTYDTAYDPDPSDPNPNPGPLVVGIENVTGTVGLGINATVNATNLLPLAQTGSVFYAPKSTTLSVPDLEVFDIQNSESAGFFLPVPGSSFKVDANLVNVGTTDILSTTTINASIRQAGSPLYLDFLTIPSVNQGATESFEFGAPLILTTSGSFEFTVDLTNNDDVNPSNNRKIVEVNALDTVGGSTTFGYTTFLDATGVDAQVNWTGTGGDNGAAVYIEPYGYPTSFTAAEVFVLPPTANGIADTFADGNMRIEVYLSDPSGAIPGANMVFDTILDRSDIDINGPFDAMNQFLPGAWNTITFPTPIEVTQGGIYIAWFHYNDSIILGGETATPISRRSFEILSGTWAPHRSRNDEDYGIRAIADVSEIVTRPPDGIEAASDITGFDAYPNPTEGMLNLDVKFANPTAVTVRVLNMNGAKVHYASYKNTQGINEIVDLRNVAKGIYLVQIETEKGIETKKIAVQ